MKITLKYLMEMIAPLEAGRRSNDLQYLPLSDQILTAVLP